MSTPATPLTTQQTKNLFPYACLGLAVITGVFFRFFGLDTSPLSVDEYYLTRSILNVLESGLPEFSAGGGYYTRGLIQQYLTAGILILGGGIEWSTRLIPAITSLICLPAIYLIGKRLSGTWVACAATILFSLSLWEIEFARFARMYSPFQALFLWYVYFIIRAVTDGNCKSLVMAYLLSFVAIFAYEGSPFLMCINLLPIFSIHFRALSKYLLLIPPLILLYIGLESINQIEGPAKLPPDLLNHESADVNFGVILPPLLLGYALKSTTWALLFIIPALITLFLFIKIAIEKSRFQLWSLLFSLALISSLLNQIGLAFISLIVGSVLFRSPNSQSRLNYKLALTMAGCIFLNSAYWIAFGLLSQDWYGLTSNLPLETYPHKTTQLAGILLNYPETITRFALTWIRPMPIMALLLFTGFAYSLFTAIFKPHKINDDLRILIAIIAAAILFISFINTIQKISRYSFFFYPLFIIVLSYSTYHFLSSIFNKRNIHIAFTCSIAAFIIISDDTGLQHLININQPEVMYRAQYSQDKASHYYPRRDFRSPSQFVNKHRKSDDLVISEVSVADLYLEEKMDYIYLPMEQNRFWQRAVLGGTKDRWTNANLLFRNTDLLEKLNKSEKRIWLMVFAINWLDKPITRFRDRYHQSLQYTSSDGTIDVFLIEKNHNTMNNRVQQ